MRFTDIFIKRPVLASVVSLLILLFGLRSISELPLRQFPSLESSVVTIITAYPGASAELVQGFITTPLTQALGTTEGLDYITAESVPGLSSISIHLQLNYNIDKAFTSVMSKVSEVNYLLPRESEDPIISKEAEGSVALMYISYDSDYMNPQQITDYVSRVVQPKIEAVAGVGKAEIFGAQTFAMRIWLNPQQMASFNITAKDVENALQANNFQSTAGVTKGEYTISDVRAVTDLVDIEGFKNLIVRRNDDALIRLRDIATVELGAQNYNSVVTFNGNQAVFMAVDTIPDANPLTVIKEVRELLPELEASFPPSLTLNVAYDATEYIDAAINEVQFTIFEASIIVIIVIFLFLGSFRAVAIPIITIPLSLIGVATFMLMMGYSINLLTLLALVLAIGIVVDDAIVVVENIHRHIENGETPLDASLKGAREIAGPVIVMTLTLAAVYAPIGFIGGITGALFKEFAFALAGAVIISGIVALTLSPMMCSKLLTDHNSESRLVRIIDDYFERLKNRYQHYLNKSLNNRSIIVVFAATVLISISYLYTHTQQELAPEEDQNVLFGFFIGPQYANIDYMTKYGSQLNEIFASFPETQHYFAINGMGAVNVTIAGYLLKPWTQRNRTPKDLQPELQAKISQVAGITGGIVSLPALPTGFGGFPIQFVITSTEPYSSLYQLANQLMTNASQSGYFIHLESSLKFNRPEIEVIIDRSKVAELGLNMQDIGQVLSTMLGENYTNRFSMEGRSYQVIAQVDDRYRLNAQQILNYYIATTNGKMIPLSTVVKLNPTTRPNKLSQFQQLNSVTIQGIMRPGVSIGNALDYLSSEADTILPKTVTYDYAGQSREFIQEGNVLVYTFFFALIIIFLILAAQFESFRDPWIILISVPMSISGALIFLNLIPSATINIYSQIALVTLIGLISKHGILMVEFANQLQIKEKLSVRDAIEQASAIRLRPILMTAAATTLGVVPLLLASGAGAVARYNIGLVISTGMTIGTIFTLFVVPTIYTLLARDRNKVVPT